MANSWEKEFPDSLYHDMWKRNFVTGARMPLSWAVKAYELNRAADMLFDASEKARKKVIEDSLKEHQERKKSGKRQYSRTLSREEAGLYHDMNLCSISFMLTGLAIENMAKAILIFRNPSYVDDDEGKLKAILIHDLDRLVQQCQIDLSDREREILRALSVYVSWAGRYPVPPKVRFAKRNSDGSFENAPAINWRDHDDIEKFIEKLSRLVEDVFDAERKERTED
jgi:hypothetical protein